MQEICTYNIPIAPFDNTSFAMFINHNRLKTKTPDNGIDRKEYISLLVDEFYETTDIEAKEQVTANLANFAYDPINYTYLKSASAVELFIELISSANPVLVRHGVAGICNLCLEFECHQKILTLNGIERISLLIHHQSNDIVLDAIATLIQLITPQTRSSIFTLANIKSVESLQNSPNILLKNFAIVFLEYSRSEQQI